MNKKNRFFMLRLLLYSVHSLLFIDYMRTVVCAIAYYLVMQSLFRGPNLIKTTLTSRTILFLLLRLSGPSGSASYGAQARRLPWSLRDRAKGFACPKPLNSNDPNATFDPPRSRVILHSAACPNGRLRGHHDARIGISL